MENSPSLMFLLASTLITGGGAVITWLVRQNASLQLRVDATNKEVIDALKVSAKLGEKVPEMTVQLQQSNDENRLLRMRIEELERKS